MKLKKLHKVNQFVDLVSFCMAGEMWDDSVLFELEVLETSVFLKMYEIYLSQNKFKELLNSFPNAKIESKGNGEVHITVEL